MALKADERAAARKELTPLAADTSVPPVDVPERRLVSNTLVQFVPHFLRIAMGLVLAATLSRYLGVQHFGEYGLVFAYVALFQGIFADWGLGTISLREVAAGAPRQLLASAAYLQAIFSTGAYVLLLTSLSVTHFPMVVKLGAAVYGLSLLAAPIDLLALTFQADLHLARLVPASLVGSVATFVLSMGVVLLGGDVLSLAAAAVGALLLQYFVVIRLLTRTRLFTAPPGRSHWKSLLRESWPLAVGSIFASVLQQAPIMALSYLSLGAVGIYAAANKIPLQLVILPLILRTSTFPLMAQSWKEDRVKFGHRFNLLMGLTGLVGSMIAIGGAVSASIVMPLIFGSRFASGSSTLAWLMLTAGILIPGIMLGEVMIAAGMQRVNLAVLVGSLPVLAAGLLLFIPRWGAAGAAAGVAMTYAAIVVADIVFLRVRMGRQAPMKWLVSPIAMGAVALVASQAARGLGSTAAGSVTLVVALTVGLLMQRRAVAWALSRLRPRRVAR